MEAQGMLLLFDLGIIIFSSTLFAFFAKILKQPLIVAYVIAGIVVGPFGLRLVTNDEIIKIFAELGIAFLLFFVGLELDIKKLKNVGRVSISCGIGQILFTFIFGFLLSSLFGLSQIEAFYVSFALTISSTTVVVKLLSDINELQTLHGKIVLGILLVQDVITIVVLAALPNLGNFSIVPLLLSVVKGFGFFSISVVIGRFILPPLIGFSSRSLELLFLFALSVCFVFSFISYLLGFSISIGAFLAGLSLASFPYNLEIVSRVRSMRDFFATIFFASLGMQVSATIHDSIKPLVIEEVIIFSLFVLIGNVIIMFLIASLLGYSKRTSFLTAISVAQVSEFSLVLVSEGLSLGHIQKDILSSIAWVTLITLTISSYMIIHSSKLYRIFVPFLGFSNKIPKKKDFESISESLKNHTIVFGCHRTGYMIVKTLMRLKKKFLVVDYNPDIIKKLLTQGINCIYGDIEDLEILERVNLKGAELVISTIPTHDDNLMLLKKVRELNSGAFFVVRAESIDNALELYEKGADFVIFPEMQSGERTSELLEIYERNKYLFSEIKQKEIRKLEKIKEEELLLKYEPSLLKHQKRKFLL
ncbi:MAG: cation:proton antiporter [Candidatus Altiarchaeota archaeon]